MKDNRRTKAQLLSELTELRQRVAELEALEAERKQAEEALRQYAGQNAQLCESAQSRARHLTTLNEIGQAIVSTLDLDSVLTTLLDRARDVVNVEACSVALVGPEMGDLIFRRAVGAAS